MVFRILILAWRKHGMAPEEFKNHYDNVHVPLVRELTGPLFPLSHRRSYIKRSQHQNGTYPAAVIQGNQEDFGFDCVAELAYEDEAHFQASGAALSTPEAGKRIYEDCVQFMDMSKAQIVVLGDVEEAMK
ncbi:uncharacterized protein AB675_1786 [Cyphellophora attinorum]|uniref:EthD domain-containing protein n=1 Tax=Cyphellophora attinorum TaxID=1664694 RepID=A0A0N0NPQ1_9EURO|nr:uncharacterized protein AB675_1786 [Phialophora attinorum]KPI43011.1 hypothetical protein AB675_1786 [Phialophora attinorum]